MNFYDWNPPPRGPDQAETVSGPRKPPLALLVKPPEGHHSSDPFHR